MNKEINNFKTLAQAIEFFADPENAHRLMVQLRWPDGQVCCPNCGSFRVRYIQTRRQWECREQHPTRRFSLKTGTIMEESPLPLKTWLAALWMEVNCKNSISSYEIHRALGITQKSAWFLLHRIRFAIKNNSFEKVGGSGTVIEADETFVGGKAEFMHLKRRKKVVVGRGSGGSLNKTAVVGLLDRHSDKHSKVRAVVLEGHVNRKALHAVIHKHVEPGTHLITDAHPGYEKLGSDYIHSFIDHAEKYVDGIVHTNGLENFWSLFKRCIKGTHVSVEPFHLAAYLDSEAFRFNNRKVKDGDRFALALDGISGKRLTYKTLIGQNDPEGRSESGSAGASA